MYAEKAAEECHAWRHIQCQLAQVNSLGHDGTIKPNIQSQASSLGVAWGECREDSAQTVSPNFRETISTHTSFVRSDSLYIGMTTKSSASA